MLVERAFVFGVSGRAILAVVAVAFSVFYALLSSAALAGLEGSGSTLDDARADPGWVLHEADLAPFAAALVPSDAQAVYVAQMEHIVVATITPWPYGAQGNLTGLGATRLVPDHPVLGELNWTRADVPLVPRHAYVLDRERFDALVPQASGFVTAAFVEGTDPPQTDLVVTPWRGVAPFYEDGADQITGGIVALVLASGGVAALLAAGFVRLEVLARQGDLATLAALGGPAVARRVVRLRAWVLVAAGLLVGLVASFVAVRLLSAIAGGPPLEIPPLVIGLTILASGGGSALFAARAGMRTLGRRDIGRAGTSMPRRFPGPVRFLFVTPRIFTGVVAAMVVTTSILGVVLAAAGIPDTLFRTEAGEVLLIEGTGNPLRGHTDGFVASQARFLEGVEAAMPQTFAPTTWQGEPIMVMGTDMHAWRDYAGPRLIDGTWPASVGEASIGARAARVLDLGPGDHLVVPRSYEVGVARIDIVAVHATGGLEDDEVWTDLVTGADLAGLDAGQASLARVRLEGTDTTWAQVQPASGIEVVGLALVPDPPAPLTPATVNVHVINFANTRQVRDLDVRLNDNIVASVRVAMDPRTTSTLDVPVIMPDADRFRLEVNPTEEYEARPGGLDVTVPSVARPGEPFVVHVERLQEPAVGARLTVDGDAAGEADDDGNISVVVASARLASLVATRDEHSGGALVRVAPAAWDNESHLAVERWVFGEPERHNDTHVVLPATLVFANLGGAPFDDTLHWTVNDATVGNATFAVRSGERLTVSASLVAPLGSHVARVLSFERSYSVHEASGAAAPPGDGAPDSGDEPPPEDEEDTLPLAETETVEGLLAERARRAREGAGESTDRTEDFLVQLFDALDTAISLVVVVTVAHAGGVVWVAVVREVRERSAVVDLHHRIGASRGQVRARAARDAAVASVPAVLVGGLVAWGAMRLLGFVRFPAAFGHGLGAEPSASLLLRVGLALVGLAALAGAYAAAPGSDRPRVTHERRLADWIERVAP